jgi:hypothetical protein
MKYRSSAFCGMLSLLKPATTAGRMSEGMIPQTEPYVTCKREPFFSAVLRGDLQPAGLFFAVMVALNRNKSYRQWRPWLINSATKLIKKMRYCLKNDPWIQRLEARYQQEPTPCVVTRVLISFWAAVFGITVQELCQLLSEERDSALRRAFGLGWGQRCYPQRISELHRVLGGVEGKAEMHSHSRDLVCELLELRGLTEADVESTAASHTFDAVMSELGQGYGFDYFLSFVFWQGILAQLEGALTQELKPNGYNLRDLFTSYLERLDEVVKTQDDLEAKLRNRMWCGQAQGVVAPVSQTLTHFLLKLGLEQLVLLHQKEVGKAHQGKRRIVVAIDAVLIELFGQYEGADWHWDHTQHRALFGYKLHVIFSVTSGTPIAFYLHQQGDKDADVLDHLLQQARSALGVKHVGIVLFDKGYWRVGMFKKLAEKDRESLITPGKRYKDVKEALAAIPQRRWCRVGVNLRCAETTVFFGQQDVRFRLVAWKKLGRRAIRDDQGKRVKDENGKVMFELVVLVHSYLTNLSQVELEADQLLAMYGQRWGVEDFFEELQNQYYLNKFPGTSLQVVKRHIILTFFLYVLVKRFQMLAAEWLADAAYATMELRRFCKEFLRAPISYLLWLKAGKSKEQAKQGARCSSLFLRPLLSLGSSP